MELHQRSPIVDFLLKQVPKQCCSSPLSPAPVSVCAAGDGICLMGFAFQCSMTPSVILPCQLHFPFPSTALSRLSCCKKKKPFFFILHWRASDPLRPIAGPSSSSKFTQVPKKARGSLTFFLQHLNTCRFVSASAFFPPVIYCFTPILLLIAAAFNIKPSSPNIPHALTCQRTDARCSSVWSVNSRLEEDVRPGAPRKGSVSGTGSAAPVPPTGRHPGG